jgi:hypothetical protein
MDIVALVVPVLPVPFVGNVSKCRCRLKVSEVSGNRSTASFLGSWSASMSPVSILVPSCDRYRDLWKPFMTLFRRHWPDCPYPVYFGSNHALYTEHDVTPLAIGDDITWTKGVRAMLEQIDSPTVLILLDDFFFRSKVDTAAIEGLFRDFERLGAAYLRLVPMPPPDQKMARFEHVGEIAPGAPYRASLQAAFWRKTDLLALLDDQENPWQMEVLGSRRSDAFERGFYSTWSPALDYYAGVVAGRWEPLGVAVCREQGVAIDLDARGVMSARENLTRQAQSLMWKPWFMLPWQQRNQLLRWFRATGLRKPHRAGY